MTGVARYSRAYRLAELRRFPGWADLTGDRTADLPDDTVVYLRDDLGVTTEPVVPERPALVDPAAGRQPDWARFCADHLDFSTPEDLIDG